MDLRVSRSLAGKVAIVTGAGCAGDGIGNGRAAAILLAQDGASVLCVDKSEEWAKKTVEIITKDGHGTASVSTGDVSMEEDCKRIVNEAVTRYGRLDILINNVGIGGPLGTALNVDLQQWDAALQVNLKSMVLMSRFAVPEMLKNKDEIKGSIVNVASVAALGGGLANLFYHVSKGAVVPLTKAMAWQHGKDGIRVNCVCPGKTLTGGDLVRSTDTFDTGSVYTPMIFATPYGTDELRRLRAEGNMLGIEGTGWDTGYGVRWLAGPEARWITGVILPVDAGLTATINLSIGNAR